MTTLDVGMAALRSSLSALRSAAERGYDLYDRTSAVLKGVMPKGLYAHALLIIAPYMVLQSVVAFMFMERHYKAWVTQRLSAGVVQDIATLIEIDKAFPQRARAAARIGQDKLGLSLIFCRSPSCRRRGPSRSSRWWTERRSRRRSENRLGGPFWIDTVGRSALPRPYRSTAP
jgi:two-component system osmolarity sensor histidine kinase EnvZ